MEPGGNRGFAHLGYSDLFLYGLARAKRVAHAFVIISKEFVAWRVWGFRTDCIVQFFTHLIFKML
jgi:hypothetical protein